MSAHPQPQLDAIVFQLAAALETYEHEVDALLAAWPDMERYQVVSERIDEVRRYAASLPTVSVQFVGLLIAHTELVHALWKQVNAPSPVDAQQLQAARAQHRDCAAALRARCKGLLLARSEAGPAA